MSENTSPSLLSPTVIRLGLGLSVALVIVAGGAFYYASRLSHRSAAQNVAGATTVTIAGRACDPQELTVPAGRRTFLIVNKSDRAVEWEILDGVMVVEERENIAPGFTQSLSARLQPGDYEITCGLLSNPRGKLHVTPSAENDAASATSTLTAFIGALAEYKVYLAGETREFVSAVGALTDAIKAGNIDDARKLYEPARIAYSHLAPVAGPLSDLDAAINARANDYEKKEADPAFGGLHRIEYGLFAQNSLNGLAPVATKLSDDAGQLAGRIHDLKVMPDHMVSGAASALQRFASTTAEAEDDRYVHSDLTSLAATLDGVRRVTDLMRPGAIKTSAAIYQSIDKQFAELDAALAKLKSGDGFVGYDSVSDSDKAALKTAAAALADDLGKLRDQLGASS
ncbi:iron uptake system protein EfeO [Neorhizobium sp. NCHU2750]|uniref:iron uptake system protein EfeO n=1 Tax=Neorhizobium sp. NCHU2750 TaxID=1825976 RepID=UPI000E728C23|nr:iron uptake system component EfeO [Neorhizobium sp. NCHU2750]